jgi:ABC-type transporter Mla maintaining outer membrane lipid asymmetry ATPase subunit MlaF
MLSGGSRGGASPSTDSAAIEVRGLTKFYGESRGIENLDLKVERGEVFGFLGPNGAGKTRRSGSSSTWPGAA